MEENVQRAEQNKKQIVKLADDVDQELLGLDEKLDEVLEKREKEFLNAYRHHMTQVQKELNVLKARANESELKQRQAE